LFCAWAKCHWGDEKGLSWAASERDGSFSELQFEADSGRSHKWRFVGAAAKDSERLVIMIVMMMMLLLCCWWSSVAVEDGLSFASHLLRFCGARARVWKKAENGEQKGSKSGRRPA